MNSSKNKSFNQVRDRLKQEPDEKVIDILPEEMDAFEQLIFENGLRIEAVHCHKPLDLLLVVLNNKKTIKVAISDFGRLKGASQAQLNNHKLIAGRRGVHWPELDEDLSLKGFLKYDLTHYVGESHTA